jgi:hypothetical protein
MLHRRNFSVGDAVTQTSADYAVPAAIAAVFPATAAPTVVAVAVQVH